jgi:hypothetical protein
MLIASVALVAAGVLYGFGAWRERSWIRRLATVTGIGSILAIILILLPTTSARVGAVISVLVAVVAVRYLPLGRALLVSGALAIGITTLCGALDRPSWTYTGWLTAIGAAVFAVCLLVFPEGRRLVIAVPAVCFIVGVVLVVDVGLAVVADQRDADQASAYRGHCAAADRLSAAHRDDAGGKELDAALSEPEPEAEEQASAACLAAATRLLPSASATTTVPPAAPVTIGDTLAVPPPDEPEIPLATAASAGVTDVLLDIDVIDAEADAWTWVALAVALAFVLVLWARMVQGISRRYQPAAVDLAACVDGSANKDQGPSEVVGISSGLRRQLLSSDESNRLNLHAAPVPAANLSDDVISLVEQSGAASAQLIAGLMRVVRATFGAGNELSVRPTLTALSDSEITVMFEIAESGSTRVLANCEVSGKDRAEVLRKSALVIEQEVRRRRASTKPPAWAMLAPEDLVAFEDAVAAETQQFENAGVTQ